MASGTRNRKLVVNYLRVKERASQMASYAMSDEATEGRKFPEPEHPYRSPYQRDRDRIVHTKAFRRLENKTQVFAPDFSDHFRNRLTHTIEVSQIARTISRTLGLNTDLCEVLALSHDIGHPPFGHKGERVLNQIMGHYRAGFDHNLHALRIVEDFEEKYAAFRGLNLTFEVREGIVKHSRDYDPADPLGSDLAKYRLGERPTLEAQLIDLADEIAYNSADLDDGYDSGLLPVNTMLEGVQLFRLYFQQARSLYPDSREKLWVSETIRKIINHLVGNLVETTHASLEKWNIRDVPAVRRHPGRLVGFDAKTDALNKELKDFLHRELYNHPQLRKARQSAGKIIEQLFRYYYRQPDRLPGSHFRRIGELSLHRVVCDYVAGMTDTFAASRYSDLIGEVK